jgi:hypothetical protein
MGIFLGSVHVGCYSHAVCAYLLYMDVHVFCNIKKVFCYYFIE